MTRFESSSPRKVTREHSSREEEERDLTIRYLQHGPVIEIIDRIVDCLGGISLEFDRWDEEYIKGPGCYIAVVCGSSVGEYADPMGKNRWDTDQCESIFEEMENLYSTMLETARTCDGAIITSVDGIILQQMVRLKDRRFSESEKEWIEYADWMGSRHMSAVDTSTRSDVVAAITLSEENGRVTVCIDGKYEDYTREDLGGRWRLTDHPMLE